MVNNNIMIKNNSFIQSMHNDIQCIESLDPNDKGTSRQYWFSASMLANIFDISKQTVRSNVDFLVKWGEVTVVKNLTTVQMSSGSGAVNDTTLYDLQVFNKLAMQLRTDAAMEIRSKFSDVLVEVETTGQYNVQKQDPSYMIEDPIERAKAWIKEQEEKRALEAEKNELITHNKALEEKNKDLQSTNDELVTEVEILLNSYVNTKQVYEMYLQNYPEAPNQAKSTMMGKIRKALCNICNERKTGRKIYKKHILNQKNEIEWRQEYFFDQDTKQILFDRVEDDLNYIVNIKLR